MGNQVDKQRVSNNIIEDDEAREKREKQMKKRKDIVNEVADTERRYVAQLTTAVNVWLETIKKLKIVKEDDIKAMFSIIEVLQTFHTQFLSDFESRMKELENSGNSVAELCVSDIFIKSGDFMRFYKTYVNNFDNASVVYSKLKESNKDFQRYLDETKQRPECNGLDLMSFLITPVQRLPRYQMLLEDLVRNTPASHPDFGQLPSALQKVVEVASFINEEKRKQEKTQKVLQIQSTLVGDSSFNLVEPHRKFLSEGDMKCYEEIGKGQSPKVIDFHYFLFNDLLLLVVRDKKNSAKWRIKMNAHIVVTDVRDVVDTPYRKNCCELIFRQTLFIVGFTSNQEKEEWMKNFLFLKAKAHSFFSSKEQVVSEQERNKQQIIDETDKERSKKEKEEKEKLIKEQKEKEKLEKKAKREEEKKAKESPKVVNKQEKGKNDKKPSTPVTDKKKDKDNKGKTKEKSQKVPQQTNKKGEKKPLLDKNGQPTNPDQEQGCSCVIV